MPRGATRRPAGAVGMRQTSCEQALRSRSSSPHRGVLLRARCRAGWPAEANRPCPGARPTTAHPCPR
eukprot:14359255-Alexandrium_andersonii.AAC.1